MARVKKGSARKKSNKRILKSVKGNRGAAGRQLRLAKEASVRAQVNARRGRREKKRNFRRMWITRINAACKQRDIKYNQFIHGCKQANIGLNKKMMSEIAASDPAAFDKIVEKAKAAL